MASRTVLTRRANVKACRQVGMNARPVAGLARELGVCWATVMDALEEHGRPLLDDPDRLGPVTTLAVDETSGRQPEALHDLRDRPGRPHRPQDDRAGTSNDWETIAARAPGLAATMRRYLAQQAVTLAPRTSEAADSALRRFALWVTEHDPAVAAAADLNRPTSRPSKLYCHATGNTRTGKPSATNTT